MLIYLFGVCYNEIKIEERSFFMKLSVSVYSFSAYKKRTGASYEEICRMTKEMGFDGIEFTEIVPEGDETKEETARRVRNICDALSLPVYSYAVGANFLCDDPEAETERIMREADIAKILGAPFMRHDASFALKSIEGYTWEDGVRDMAPYIRRVAEYAAGLGIKTGSENHGYIYQDPERMLALIHAVNHENYGWLFDMGNFSVVDRDAREAFEMARPYIFHVHAKDMILKKGAHINPAGFHQSRGGNLWRGTVLGHGQVPVAETFAFLKASGYDGTVSLEFEGAEDNIPAIEQGLAYMKALIQ